MKIMMISFCQNEAQVTLYLTFYWEDFGLSLSIYQNTVLISIVANGTQSGRHVLCTHGHSHCLFRKLQEIRITDAFCSCLYDKLWQLNTFFFNTFSWFPTGFRLIVSTYIIWDMQIHKHQSVHNAPTLYWEAGQTPRLRYTVIPPFVTDRHLSYQ